MTKIIRRTVILAAALLGAGLVAPAGAAIIYANQVTNLVRGDATIGNSTGYYGGFAPFTTPTELTADQARANVLGAPDGNFTALPGRDDVASGSPWPYMYVEVSFGTTFTAQDKLVITEFGDAGESALIWLWSTTGEYVQTRIQRGISDTMIVDLTPWAGLYAGFDRVGIGGLDLLGSAEGFDLDAVGIQPIPVPAAVWLLASALLAGLGVVRQRRSR